MSLALPSFLDLLLMAYWEGEGFKEWGLSSVQPQKRSSLNQENPSFLHDSWQI